jgi:hypothetical protein
MKFFTRAISGLLHIIFIEQGYIIDMKISEALHIFMINLTCEDAQLTNSMKLCFIIYE